MAEVQQTRVPTSSLAFEYSNIRSELSAHLSKKLTLSLGPNFSEIDMTKNYSPISHEQQEKIHEIDKQIAACYLRMREIVRLARERG